MKQTDAQVNSLDTKGKAALHKFKKNAKHFIALVMMQLKDKLDFSFVSSKKKAITKIVFLVLRIAAVIAVSYFAFYFGSVLSIFAKAGPVPVEVVNIIYILIFVLSLLSCTAGLMKTLFFADDNRVLVTLPVTGNAVFFSKLVVYYIFELERSMTFTLPLLIGYGMAAGLPTGIYFWLVFVLLFVSAAPVVIGALISLPTMVVYQFLKKHDAIKIIFFVLIISAFIAAIVKVILLIPDDINLILQWKHIQPDLESFIKQFSGVYTLWFFKITTMMVGTYSNMQFSFGAESLITFVCFVGILAVILGIVYLIAKPLFFKMTAQPFEFEKNEKIKAKENRRRKKYKSILRKEFLLNLRSTEISYSFLAIYIALPILILLLNKVFGAMAIKQLGQYMAYSFNLLIILLILFASNAIISTMYSMEGRAGYMKKTKPLELFMPLICKVFYNGIFSVVSITVTMVVLGIYSALSVGDTIMIAVCVLFFQLGHIIWSAERDIMNPQNEQYATTGGQIDNPNSNKTTVSAFLISLIVAGFSLMLFTEGGEDPTLACLKLMLIGIAFAILRGYLFFIKVRVYYREKM